MYVSICSFIVIATTVFSGSAESIALNYPIVDTNQIRTYDNDARIFYPKFVGQPFHGQDAQYQGLAPHYQDHENGTITDLNTGLMWQKSYQRASYQEARYGASACKTAGYDDWRLPTIKELYSLIDFSGIDPGLEDNQAIPFIDLDYFAFAYGDTSRGERKIDVQFWSSTEYTSATMGGNHTVFGVNFADGRIKGLSINV